MVFINVCIFAELYRIGREKPSLKRLKKWKGCFFDAENNEQIPHKVETGAIPGRRRPSARRRAHRRTQNLLAPNRFPG
jgi:hypothetical protein